MKHLGLVESADNKATVSRRVVHEADDGPGRAGGAAASSAAVGAVRAEPKKAFSGKGLPYGPLKMVPLAAGSGSGGALPDKKERARKPLLGGSTGTGRGLGGRGGAMIKTGDGQGWILGLGLAITTGGPHPLHSS